MRLLDGDGMRAPATLGSLCFGGEICPKKSTFGPPCLSSSSTLLRFLQMAASTAAHQCVALRLAKNANCLVEYTGKIWRQRFD